MNTNIKDKLFDFAYNAALNDATLQNAYSGEKKSIALNSNAKEVVKKYIDSILLGEDPDFLTAAENVGRKIEDDEFTFGNIQKLINMTVKYIFLACYADETLREKFKTCHCPMDSIMMKKVKNNYLEYNGQNKSDELIQIPVGEGKTSVDLEKTAWSKLKFERYDGPYSFSVYDNFQKMVKILADEEGILPIEYDFAEWESD